jgi:hypothetical protein
LLEFLPQKPPRGEFSPNTQATRGPPRRSKVHRVDIFSIHPNHAPRRIPISGEMQKILLFAMIACLFRRPAAYAFIENLRVPPRLSRVIASEKSPCFRRLVFSSARQEIICPYATTSSVSLLSRLFSSEHDGERIEYTQNLNDSDLDFPQPIFKKHDLVMVEVIYFGPLGASVDVVAHNSHNASDCISQEEPALGRGMILQREIDYFRRGRDGVDVVKYEILPAYVENVREVVVEDGKVEERLDISLRPPGGKAKSQDLGEQILERLKVSKVLYVGDKSSPDEINEIFPGASKSAFKKAVSGLYRRGLVNPGVNSISLM